MKRAETLNAINEILLSAVTPDELLARLVGDISKVAGADKCLVIEIRDEGFVITHVRDVRDDLVGRARSAEFFPGFALAAETKRPLLIQDTWLDPITNKRFVVPYALRAYQLLPLLVGDTVVAVLALAYDEPRAFDVDDAEFCTKAAMAMSVALRNALLYESEVTARQRAADELELTTLLVSTAGKLAEPESLDVRLQNVSELLRSSLRHERVVIDLWDEASRELRIVAVAGEDSMLTGTYQWDQCSQPIREVIETGRSVVAEFPGEPETMRGVVPAERGFRLVLIVPMLVGGRTVGLIAADQPSEALEFSARETEIVQGIASQAAAVVENERLLAAERLQSQRTELLKDVAIAAASSLDLQEVASATLRAAGDRLGAHWGVVCLLDAEAGVFRRLASVGLPETPQPSEIPADETTVAGRVLTENLPFLTHEIGRPHDAASDPELCSDLQADRWIVLPIETAGKMIAALTLAFEGERSFTDGEVSLFSAVAGQLSIAIKNAQLFASETEVRRRAAALHEVTVLATSSLEMTEVADKVARHIAEKLGVNVVTFWLLNEHLGRLFPISGVGFPAEFYEHFSPGVGLDQDFEIVKAVEEREPVIRSERQLGEVPEPVRAAYERFGVDLRALLVLPVQSRNRMIGAITLAWDTPKTISADEVTFFSSVANNLAVAADNAQLFGDATRGSSLSETLNEIDVRIHSTLDLDEIMQRALDDGTLALGCDAGTIETRRGESWLVRYQHGMSEADIGRVLSEDEAPAAMSCARSRQPLVVEDVAADERMNVGFIRENGIASAMAAPLIVRDEVIGCLLFYAIENRRTFAGTEIDFTRKLAAEVSLALENAALHEASQLELKRTRVLQAVATATTGSLSLSEIAQRTLDELRALPELAAGAVYSLNDAKGKLKGLAFLGYEDDLERQVRDLAVDKTTNPGRLVAEDLALLTHEDEGCPKEADARLEKMGVPSARWLVLPIKTSGVLVGAMGLIFDGRRSFQPPELVLFQGVADTLASAFSAARLHDELQESYSATSAILESISDGFYALDRQWRFTYANAELARLVAIDSSDLVGQPLEEAFGADLAAALREVYTPAMDGDRVVESEWYIEPSSLWIETRAYPSVEGISVYVTDVTERKAAEEALREARERADIMAMMLDESAQPFGVGSLDGSITNVNQAFCDLTGYSAEELALISWETALTPPEYTEFEAEQLAELESTGGPIRYEKEFMRKDGTRVPVELLVHLESDEGGKPEYYYSFVTDLTDRKERERLEDALNDIRTAIGGTLDRGEITAIALEAGAAAIDADSAVFFEHTAGRWSLSRSVGLPKAAAHGPLKDGDALAAPVAAAGKRAVLINDPSADPRLDPDVVKRHRVKSLIAIPLGVNGAELGAIAFYHRRSAAPFTSVQFDFASRLGHAVTLAIQNSMLYERERRIADTLQEALMTPPEPISGVEIGYVYQAASNSANVGGDFFDVFSIDERHCGILIGDVSGKGIDAARLTSLLHHGVRAYSMETIDAREVLDRLNRLVCRLSPVDQYATVFLGVLDLANGKLRYCSAGHPLPVVLSEKEAIFLTTTRSPLLGGFAEAEFRSLDTVLLPGETLVLYTDGVTEARREGELLGEERLLRLLGKMTRTPTSKLPQRLLDRVLDFSDGHLRDDTVILSVALAEKADGTLGGSDVRLASA
jgi:PAS domain S-box-containing protein